MNLIEMHYSFEGGDGTKVSSEGELKSFDSDRTGEAVVGSVFYKVSKHCFISTPFSSSTTWHKTPILIRTKRV